MSNYILEQNMAAARLQEGSWRRVDTVGVHVHSDNATAGYLYAIFEKDETSAEPERIAYPLMPPFEVQVKPHA